MLTRRKLIKEYNNNGEKLRKNVLDMTDEEYYQCLGALKVLSVLLDGYDRATLRVNSIKNYYDEKRNERGNQNA